MKRVTEKPNQKHRFSSASIAVGSLVGTGCFALGLTPTEVGSPGAVAYLLAEVLALSAVLSKAPPTDVSRVPICPELEAPMDRPVVGVRLEVERQAELFSRIARQMSANLGIQSAEVEEALWSHEPRRHQLMTGPVALSAPRVRSAHRLRLGVFTLRKPVRFARPGLQRVDLFLVALGPPAQQPAQLRLLERLSSIAREPGVQAMREAQNADEMRSALFEAWRPMAC